jgi:phosphoribosylformylglycinamidine synthase PurS subunit
MDFLAKIYVTLKPAVNDPQGVTVLGALKNLGFTAPANVRVGKYLEVSLNAESQDAAKSQVDEMCKKLLANIVIEQYRFDLEEAPLRKPGV